MDKGRNIPVLFLGLLLLAGLSACQEEKEEVPIPAPVVEELPIVLGDEEVAGFDQPQEIEPLASDIQDIYRAPLREVRMPELSSTMPEVYDHSVGYHEAETAELRIRRVFEMELFETTAGNLRALYFEVPDEFSSRTWGTPLPMPYEKFPVQVFWGDEFTYWNWLLRGNHIAENLERSPASATDYPVATSTIYDSHGFTEPNEGRSRLQVGGREELVERARVPEEVAFLQAVLKNIGEVETRKAFMDRSVKEPSSPCLSCLEYCAVRTWWAHNRHSIFRRFYSEEFIPGENFLQKEYIGDQALQSISRQQISMRVYLTRVGLASVTHILNRDTQALSVPFEGLDEIDFIPVPPINDFLQAVENESSFDIDYSEVEEIIVEQLGLVKRSLTEFEQKLKVLETDFESRRFLFTSEEKTVLREILQKRRQTLEELQQSWQEFSDSLQAGPGDHSPILFFLDWANTTPVCVIHNIPAGLIGAHRLVYANIRLSEKAKAAERNIREAAIRRVWALDRVYQELKQAYSQKLNPAR